MVLWYNSYLLKIYDYHKGEFIMKNWSSSDKQFVATIIMKFIDVVVLTVLFYAIAR